MFNKISFLILVCFGLLAFNFNKFDDEPDNLKTKKTGIMLDSMNNEVVLVFEDNLPIYYMSEIFTPVCNTGECLPVYVNIYWEFER